MGGVGRTLVWSVGGLVLSVWLVGCGGSPSTGPSPTNLHHLAALFLQYTAANKGQPPKSLDDFKKYVKGDGPRLQAMKVTDPETLFVSPRDNQPYVLNFKIKSTIPDAKGAPLFAYEKSGVNGKRYIALATGQVKEIDEDEFKNLVAKGQ